MLMQLIAPELGTGPVEMPTSLMPQVPASAGAPPPTSSAAIEDEASSNPPLRRPMRICIATLPSLNSWQQRAAPLRCGWPPHPTTLRETALCRASHSRERQEKRPGPVADRQQLVRERHSI